VEVEALRYAPLKVAERVRPTRLLVLGDISRIESERLLTLTVSAIERTPNSLELWFKPHPGSPGHSEMALRLGFSVTFGHLAELAPTLALAIVGVAGAASVDLTLLAVPVITVIDARTTNLSPLAGISGANFARSASQLSEFILTPQLHQISADSLAYRSVTPMRWIELVSTVK
jgi:surface carbohydrate biosynthesis protein (TIGR04326 family)